MAKLTLNNLLDMTKTHNEEQLKEILTPAFVKFYRRVYDKEKGEIDNRDNGVFIYEARQEWCFESLTDAGRERSVDSLIKFTISCQEKIKGIHRVRRSWVETGEDGLTIKCRYVAILPRKTINDKAFNSCDIFVWRLRNQSDDHHIKEWYDRIAEYINV